MSLWVGGLGGKAAGGAVTPWDANHTFAWDFAGTAAAVLHNQGSGGTCDLNVGANVTFGAKGIVGNAITMPGGSTTANCIVGAATVNPYNVDADWSWETFFYVNDLYTWLNIWSCRGNGVSDSGYDRGAAVRYQNAPFSRLWSANGDYEQLAVCPVLPGRWHHAGLTWSQSTKVLSMYQDGALVQFDNAHPTLTNRGIVQPMAIGANSDKSYCFNGRMSRFAFSNITRPASYFAGLWAAATGQ